LGSTLRKQQARNILLGVQILRFQNVEIDAWGQHVFEGLATYIHSLGGRRLGDGRRIFM
jgi:hypothetical protein